MNNDLIRNNGSASTIYIAREGVLLFIKRVKCKGSAIEMIAARGVTRKSVDAIYVFNARVIGGEATNKVDFTHDSLRLMRTQII